GSIAPCRSGVRGRRSRLELELSRVSRIRANAVAVGIVAESRVLFGRVQDDQGRPISRRKRRKERERERERARVREEERNTGWTKGGGEYSRERSICRDDPGTPRSASASPRGEESFADKDRHTRGTVIPPEQDELNGRF
ncbi:hypothetical protein DBV15_07308, partial [Temnothorax longispinosus]